MIENYLTSRFIPLPHVLTIEITSFCNLRCVMCPRTAGFVNTPPNRLISMEVIERLEPVLAAVDGADVSGLWGEAFLHSGLYLEILRRLKSRHIGVRTVSNGTLISDELAGELVALGLDSLEISVDAARPETYRRVRCGGDLEQVIEGIRAVNRHKEARGRNSPVIKLLFLGMDDTIEELPEFVRMAHSLRVRVVVLQAMGEYEQVKGKSVALHHRALGRRLLGEAQRVARNLGVTVELFPPGHLDEGARSGPEAGAGAAAVLRTRDCFFPWDRAVITAGGDVLPCCASPEAFGNLGRDSFEEIWYGETYRKLRRSLLSGSLPPMCLTCTGQAWRGVSRSDGPAAALRLERIRLRQRLRRSGALRKIRDALRSRTRGKGPWSISSTLV